MAEAVAKLAVTLHWRNPAGEQSTTAICDDRAPNELIPLLLNGCGMPKASLGYHLRLDAARGRRLADDLPISMGGVRNGSEIWLSTDLPTRQVYCLVSPPTGGAILIPAEGMTIQRAWLLAHLALLSPTGGCTQPTTSQEAPADYCWVSRQGHCLIAPSIEGWQVTSLRADRVTMLNGARLGVDQPTPLRHDDRLTLGEAGPTLVISLVASA
ncbi:MAG: FHA domain-containing protein [Oscillochloridaceae bacterium umkhey_bin13]